MRTSSLVLAAALTLAASSAFAQSTDAGPISPERLSAHVKVLADSKLAGRAPGGPGEPGTLDYLVSGALLRVLRASWEFGAALIHFQMLLLWWLVLSAGGGWLVAHVATRYLGSAYPQFFERADPANPPIREQDEAVAHRFGVAQLMDGQ